MAAAPATGRCQSRQAAPNITAASPIIAPTDRSIPPVTRIGVIATARSPTSTLRRVTSKKLPSVAKFGASAVKTTISSAMAPTSTVAGTLRFTRIAKNQIERKARKARQEHNNRPQSAQSPPRTQQSTAKRAKPAKKTTIDRKARRAR